MEEILKIFIEYISIWAPSLVAMLGVVITIITALGKTKAAFEKLKADKTLEDLNSKLSVVIEENKELVRCNKLLLNELTKIKDFADLMKKEG